MGEPSCSVRQRKRPMSFPWIHPSNRFDNQDSPSVFVVQRIWSFPHWRKLILVLFACFQNAQSLHGDIPQKQREMTLKGFRNGTFEVLVATNVAARGLDIPEVDLVIQCSPPKVWQTLLNCIVKMLFAISCLSKESSKLLSLIILLCDWQDVESYIHRSGRTGRAGRTGVCICFYQRREEDQLRYVENKAVSFSCRTAFSHSSVWPSEQLTDAARATVSIQT